MDRKMMRKRLLNLLDSVKEEDFETLLWCMQQYAAEGMNEKSEACKKTA